MDAFEKLAATLQRNTIRSINDNTSVTFELATVTFKLGLKTDRFNEEIPKGEYLIDKRLSINYRPETEVTTSSADGHKHNVKIPLTEGIARIQAGDRVIVCWAGRDPIVVAVVTDSRNIGEED